MVGLLAYGPDPAALAAAAGEALRVAVLIGTAAGVATAAVAAHAQRMPERHGRVR
jgi:hypothetical protein